MEKLKINSSLKVTGESDCTIQNVYHGKRENACILYNEGEIEVCLDIQKDKVCMSRKTNEYEIEMVFLLDQTIDGKYDILDMDMQMDLKVRTSQLKMKDGHLDVIYHLTVNGENIGTYAFKLEYEVVE